MYKVQWMHFNTILLVVFIILYMLIVMIIYQLLANEE